MHITKGQLFEIIKTNLGDNINESILLALLAGCQGNDCHLFSIAPELQDLKIPECVIKEVYPFETLDWESGVSPSELQRIALEEGYAVDMNGPIASIDDVGYVQMVITINNVPQRLVRYLSEMGILESSRENIDLRN